MAKRTYLIQCHTRSGASCGPVAGNSQRDCIQKAQEIMPWISIMALKRDYLKEVEKVVVAEGVKKA